MFLTTWHALALNPLIAPLFMDVIFNTIIPFISIAQIQQFSFQMRFTILEEIKSTLPKSLFLQSLFTNQIKSNQMFFFFFDERGKPEYPGKNLS